MRKCKSPYTKPLVLKISDNGLSAKKNGADDDSTVMIVAISFSGQIKTEYNHIDTKDKVETNSDVNNCLWAVKRMKQAQ